MTHMEIANTDAPYEAQLLQAWLVNGKPELGWRGDPRLWLGMGVVLAAAGGYSRRVNRHVSKGDIIGHRYEVWRHNEDGTDKIVLQRATDQWHDIIPALVGMDPRTPGHVDPIVEVEEHNAKVSKDNSDEWKGHHREMTEHLWRIIGEREHGRNTTYQVPGSNPDKQM